MESSIHDVSDTALWVAHYRALETERSDALFHDPLAKVLVGERGRAIAESMKATSLHVQWSVVIRTRIIDRYIEELIGEGIDAVINLGAGLDTRPYRLKLPPGFRWIEVDMPGPIERKEKLLAGEKLVCHLERVGLDLADDAKRRAFLTRVGGECKKALVLTEGVIPYLSEEQVASLGRDIHSQRGLAFWVAEYFSPLLFRFLKNSQRMKKMKNAPFLFFPKDWYGLFAGAGWEPREMRYISVESMKLGRPIPRPWWAILGYLFMPKKKIKQHEEMSGYALLKKKQG